MAGSDEVRDLRGPGDITRSPALIAVKVTATRSIGRFPILSTPNCGHARITTTTHRAPGDTLQPTALVHETYVKLLGARRVAKVGRPRRHFFAVASRAMRQISVDYARSQVAQKRGGNTPALTLDEERLPVADRAQDLVLLDRRSRSSSASACVRPAWSSCASLAGCRLKRLQP